jgi:hypothetical protein
MMDVRGVALRCLLGLACGMLFYSPKFLKKPELYAFVHQVVDDPSLFVFSDLMIHGYVVEGSVTEGTGDQAVLLRPGEPW